MPAGYVFLRFKLIRFYFTGIKITAGSQQKLTTDRKLVLASQKEIFLQQESRPESATTFKFEHISKAWYLAKACNSILPSFCRRIVLVDVA